MCVAVCVCARVCVGVHVCVFVSQVIFDTKLRETVFLDLRLAVRLRPSDTVKLVEGWRGNREGGMGR